MSGAANLCDGGAGGGTGGIVVSYRRCDRTGRTLDHALFTELLAQELADHFGADTVSLAATPAGCGNGQDHQDDLRTRLAACDVLLVVIHPGWLDDLCTGRDARLHKLLGTALRLRSGSAPPRQRPTVIPVLLDQAAQPMPGDLPDDLRELALLQAFRLRFGALPVDLVRLIAELELHVTPCWPPADPPSPDPVADGPTARMTPGYAVSRGSVIVACLVGFLSFMPRTGSADWTSAIILLLWSAATIILTLLAMAAVTIFGGWIHQLEHHLHALPKPWLLIVRLGLVGTVVVLVLAFVAPFDDNKVIALFVILPASLPLLIGTMVLTVREMIEDDLWPPRVATRAMSLRRAIARLEHRLTSSWQPPLSRLQHEQAEQIVRQLDNALVIMGQFRERTRTRVGWLRYSGRGVAVGYAVWLAATLGLAVTATRQSFTSGDVLGGYLSIPIGLLACLAGLGALELMYRHDRSSWRRFADEIDKDLNTRLRRRLPAAVPATGQP